MVRNGNWVQTIPGFWRWWPQTQPAIYRPPMILNGILNPTTQNVPGAAVPNAWLVASLGPAGVPPTARFVHMRGFFVGGVAAGGAGMMVHVDFGWHEGNHTGSTPPTSLGNPAVWPGMEQGENAIQGALYDAVSLPGQQLRDTWTIYVPVSLLNGSPMVWFRWRPVALNTSNRIGYWLGVDAYEAPPEPASPAPEPAPPLPPAPGPSAAEQALADIQGVLDAYRAALP